MTNEDEILTEPEVMSEDEAERRGIQPIFASGAKRQMEKELENYNSKSPKLSGGDVDAAWQNADVGEESVGGGNPTPDQDVVEELGEAYGITYQDNEPLDTEGKLEDRDENRWELNPASAEDFSK